MADFVSRRPGALDRAYRAYGSLLYSVARHILGNDDDAMDCVHDALVRIWYRSETFRPERGSLRAYLAVCVRNEAIGRKRAAARHFTIEQRALEARVEQSYELEIQDVALRERLRSALGALPSEQREALVLSYGRHLSHGQISESLGVPLGTIKSRIALALRKLQKALAAHEHREC